MNERKIFFGAMDRVDPVERAAYLDSMCAGRPELRRRIDELLESHEQASDFLGVPAMEQLATAEKALDFLDEPSQEDSLGRLDHYEILRVVGHGSTGMVLKALDTKLHRVVAIKMLSLRLAANGQARRRFVREAQAAAAVRDDHVIGIYAVSDEGPVPYLVMEYINGVTLEQRVKEAGPLSVI